MSARRDARIRANRLMVWNQYIELADSAYCLGKFDVGDKMLRAAAKECAGDAEMCLILARFYERLTKVQIVAAEPMRCERLMKKAIGMYERIADDASTEQIARLLIDLAELSAKNNKHQVAMRYFGRALIVGKRSKTPHAAERIVQMKRLFNVWSNKGRHEEALIVYNHCCRLSQDSRKPAAPLYSE